MLDGLVAVQPGRDGKCLVIIDIALLYTSFATL
jgi:hypothetical protein